MIQNILNPRNASRDSTRELVLGRLPEIGLINAFGGGGNQIGIVLRFRSGLRRFHMYLTIDGELVNSFYCKSSIPLISPKPKSPCRHF